MKKEKMCEIKVKLTDKQMDYVKRWAGRRDMPISEAVRTMVDMKRRQENEARENT